MEEEEEEEEREREGKKGMKREGTGIPMISLFEGTELLAATLDRTRHGASALLLLLYTHSLTLSYLLPYAEMRARMQERVCVCLDSPLFSLPPFRSQA